MLKVRVIPTLLLKDFGLVKGKCFDSWRRVGTALPAIRVYNKREVDELILVDIEANKSDTELDYETVNDCGENCFVPLTVGGGIKNSDQVQNLLRQGADKVTINTSAYSQPTLISEISNRHGSQCVVSSIDVKGNSKEGWLCYSHSGTYATGKEVLDWAKEVEQRGAGEILLTSIDLDGTMKGYDLHLIEKVVNQVNIPVIASGGAGNYQHMIDAVKKSGASAVAAASIFHFTEQTPLGAKEALSEAGVPVRNKFVGG